MSCRLVFSLSLSLSHTHTFQTPNMALTPYARFFETIPHALHRLQSTRVARIFLAALKRECGITVESSLETHAGFGRALLTLIQLRIVLTSPMFRLLAHGGGTLGHYWLSPRAILPE
jgi:hypothetical protein